MSALKRFWWVAFIGLGLLITFAGLSALTDLESRLGPIDPTDPGWKVRIVNDLHQTIDVKNSAEDLTIQAGDSDIFEGPGPGVRHVVYEVTDASGRRLGCLTVELDTRTTVQAKASDLRPC